MFSRLTVKKHRQFLEAVFEMVAYDYLTSNEIEVLEIEPAVPASSSRPDFLCKFEDRCFYVEVVSVHDMAHVEEQAFALHNDLKQLVGTDFEAKIEYLGSSSSQDIDTHAVRKELKAIIHANRNATDGRFVVHCITQGDWVIEVTLRRIAERDQPLFSLGTTPVRRVDANERIRATIDEKVTRYGTLDHPLIVVVNVLGGGLDMSEAWRAVFGSRAAVYEGWAATEYTHELTRNGLFFRSSKSGQLDSVMFYSHINEFSFDAVPTRRVINPMCTSPLGNVLPHCTLCELDEETSEYVNTRPDGGHWRD
jgi:hypothetical protein